MLIQLFAIQNKKTNFLIDASCGAIHYTEFWTNMNEDPIKPSQRASCLGVV